MSERKTERKTVALEPTRRLLILSQGWEAWPGELGGVEKAGTQAHSAHHCHSCLAIQHILVTEEIPWVWNGTRDPFFFLPFPPRVPLSVPPTPSVSSSSQLHSATFNLTLNLLKLAFEFSPYFCPVMNFFKFHSVPMFSFCVLFSCPLPLFLISSTSANWPFLPVPMHSPISLLMCLDAARSHADVPSLMPQTAGTVKWSMTSSASQLMHVRIDTGAHERPSNFFCVTEIGQQWYSFVSTSWSSFIKKPLDWGTQSRPPRVWKVGEFSQSQSGTNNHIITFPAAIFQLACYRSVCKPLDALCLSPTGPEATFCPSSVEISALRGGGRAHFTGKPSRYAACHPLLPVFMAKTESRGFLTEKC